MASLGFTSIRRRAIAHLLSGTFLHEARGDIDVKNHLAMGRVSALDVVALLKRSSGDQYSSSPHHRDSSIAMHVIRTGGYYLKFYFEAPHVMFISVHP